MFLVISIILAGVSLGAGVWVLMRPATARPFTAGAYSSHYLMHLLWPWVLAVKPWCEPFISWRMRAALQHKMRLAGMPAAWQPAHLVAIQTIVFLLSVAGLTTALHLGLSLTLIQAMSWAFVAGCLTAWLPRSVIQSKARARQRGMLRELPFLLDMTTLCVEAGLSLHGALQQATLHGPPGPLREELQHTLADVRAGMARLEALSALAQRTDLAAIASLVAALTQADQTGSSLGPLLRSQSDQRRSERFLRAEEQALKAPVKMLFPLVSCIFPCTFLVIGFPIVYRIFTDGF